MPLRDMQPFLGATNAHQDIFRDRVEVYREYIENVMNEEVIPRLVAMGYIEDGLEFKYSKRLEMSNKDQIDLYTFLTERYEIAADEIEKVFGVTVGRQLNLQSVDNDKVKRGVKTDVRNVVNFLKERER